MNQGFLNTYARVSNSRPCPICGKPDYCVIARDGSHALCPRTVSEREVGEAGFYHVIDASRAPVEPSKWACLPTPTIDACAIMEGFKRAVHTGRLDSHAAHLGVSPDSLRQLGIGWSNRHDAWAFPMLGPDMRVVGIRLRNEKGQKWAVSGSCNGHFSSRIDCQLTLYIVEGPTDTAALETLGMQTLGRPAASACKHECVRICKEWFAGKSIVIIADNDEPKPDGDRPGQRGAYRLADLMMERGLSCKVILPRKGKDSRAWLAAGLTREELEYTAANARPWTRTHE